MNFGKRSETRISRDVFEENATQHLISVVFLKIAKFDSWKMEENHQKRLKIRNNNLKKKIKNCENFDTFFQNQ